MQDIEQAILQEDLSAVKRILEEEPSKIDSKDENGILMSFLAARTGNLQLVRYIVEYSRASMNIVDDAHRNILHYGVLSGDVEVCRYLTEKVGMSPLTGDFALETPYELAERLGFTELVSYFEKYVGAPLRDMYKNPIRTGFFPDPSIVRVGEDYYMVNSTFVYFPCIPVSHSRDLIHWEIIGHAITNPEWCMLQGIEGGRGYWAPDISYADGRFYITATYRLNDDGTVYRKQIVVSSDKPEGPYSKPAIIDEDGIDPSIFTDDDGRHYMLLNRGARIFELNADCTKQISEAELLYYGDNKRAPEGPHLLKKDGYYYLFEAEGGTGPGHRITVSRSRTLKGNYEPCPYNPIMRQEDPGAGIQRCGHGKPVQTAEGDWYMVYLCGRKLVGPGGEAYSMLGRETALDPITWTADGWPIVNGLKGPSCLQVKPGIGATVAADGARITTAEISDEVQNETNVQISGTVAGFSADTLYQQWLTVRAPEQDGFTFADGRVGIKASRADLDTIEAKNILVRRQTAFDFTAQVTMQVPKLQPGQNCGMVCYYDENTFVKYGLFAEADGLYIGVVEKIGDDVRKSGFEKVQTALWKDIIFRVETKGLTRKFSYCADAGTDVETVEAANAADASRTVGSGGETARGERQFTESAALENVYYLCDEGLKKGKRFTGAMVGMYAYAGADEAYRAEFGDFIVT
ncbi:MAG: family 43 glycosylhydrolase [Lachnospiraceae bacterium]|nr:family 43 glycosylhydrolase [Lachnospiraceae bacterium]